MKHLLRLCLCLFVCCVGSAKAVADDAEEAKYLVITLADDSFREFQLADKPVISFNDNKLQVNAAAVSAEYARADVKSFCFMAQPTGIERVVAGGNVVLRYVDNATVSLAGVSDAAVSLYDAAGNLVSRQLPADGRVEINMQTLAPGVYILQHDKNSSIKIIKK